MAEEGFSGQKIAKKRSAEKERSGDVWNAG
jgi:hypothetical protein